MRDFFTHIKQEAAKTRLHGSEKRAMRKAVLAAISASRMPQGAAVGAHAQVSGWRSLWFFPRAGVVSLALILLVGAGTAFAAEGSLPGDLLYPIKVSVNEKVLTGIALSPKARAITEARLLERRLEEAAELGAKGEFSPEASVELARRFDEGAERLADTLEKLEAEGKLQSVEPVLERLSIGVDARAEVLGRVAREEEEEEEDTRSEGALATRAERVSKAAKRLRESLEEKLAAEARADAAMLEAAEKKIDSTEEKIERARSLREKNNERIRDDVARDVEEALERAKEQARDAREKLLSGDADSAYQKAIESRAEAEDARGRLEVEVRMNALLEKYDSRRDGSEREDDIGSPRKEAKTRSKQARFLEANGEYNETNEDVFEYGSRNEGNEDDKY
jgi:hypothetical protein